MKKIPVMLAAGVIIFMLSSCGQAKNTEDVQTDTGNDIAQISKEADEADLQEPTNMACDTAEISQDTAEKFIDYEALGIKEYEYSLEFFMGDNLKTAIAQLALGYVSFNRDTPTTGGWKETFIAEFIQNSRLTFDYLDFSSLVSGSIDRYEAASCYCSGSISGYDYVDTDSGVLITADLEIRYDGMESVQKYEITAELVRNPYSCFDGYSVASFSSKPIDSAPERDLNHL